MRSWTSHIACIFLNTLMLEVLKNKRPLNTTLHYKEQSDLCSLGNLRVTACAFPFIHQGEDKTDFKVAHQMAMKNML